MAWSGCARGGPKAWPSPVPCGRGVGGSPEGRGCGPASLWQVSPPKAWGLWGACPRLGTAAQPLPLSPAQGGSVGGAWPCPAPQLRVVCWLARGHTGIGISLYSSTPSRSSKMGSASSASSCGEMVAGWAARCSPSLIAHPRGSSRHRPEHPRGRGTQLAADRGAGTYTLHLTVGEDAAEQAHAEWHREDEDEGEGQGGHRGHDGPEHGQTCQLQPSEEVHAQRAHLHRDRCQCRGHNCARPLRPPPALAQPGPSSAPSPGHGSPQPCQSLAAPEELPCVPPADPLNEALPESVPQMPRCPQPKGVPSPRVPQAGCWPR